MKEFAKSFYNSKEWQAVRSSYIGKRMLIDGGLCEECIRKGIEHPNQGYIVHHKTMLTDANISEPSITLNEDNLMYVCKSCHDEFEGHLTGDTKVKLLCKFDEKGRPIMKRNPPRLKGAFLFISRPESAPPL